MNKQRCSISLPDGSTDAFLFSTVGECRPGVMFLTDIGGIREAELTKAQRLAEQGFSVLVPNIFYRTAKPPVMPFPADFGSEPVQKRMQELRGPLTPEAIVRDAHAYVDFLTSQPTVADGPVGVVGYCFSGAMAMRIAAECPDKVSAMGSFHAARLYLENDPNSPHLLLPKIKARLYFGHAVQDKGMPAEAIAKFEDALRKWGGQFKSETYEGAYHGWTTLDSPVYNQPQAKRAFQKLRDLLEKTLVKN
jgi:carboxymethylenebutenolidase